MATYASSHNGVPEGYATVTPWIISRDTDRLIHFLIRAFNARELGRVASPDGSIGHAEVRIGGSIVMMFDAPATWPNTPAFIRLYVADGDATFQQALDAGATPVTNMTELFFGDKAGRVRDPLGNLWWIRQRLVDIDDDQAMTRMNEPRFIEAMEYVQGAEFVPGQE